jgi:hypothetical protein
MKVRLLIACAATAAALPLAPAWASASATTLGGPQGTGAYGTVDPLDWDRDGMINAEERAAPYTAAPSRSVPSTTATASYESATLDRNADGVISPSEHAAINDARADVRRDRRNAYSGPSWATNPPAPAM